MNKKNISPNPQKPVDRVSSGQLPNELAELTEVALASSDHEGVIPSVCCLRYVQHYQNPPPPPSCCKC